MMLKGHLNLYFKNYKVKHKHTQCVKSKMQEHTFPEYLTVHATLKDILTSMFEAFNKEFSLPGSTFLTAAPSVSSFF